MSERPHFNLAACPGLSVALIHRLDAVKAHPILMTAHQGHILRVRPTQRHGRAGLECLDDQAGGAGAILGGNGQVQLITGFANGACVDAHFIVAAAGPRGVILRVDRATHLAMIEEACIQAPETLGPGVDYVAGVAKVDGGMVLIHDLSTFLSAAEAAGLDHALDTVDPT